MEIINGSIQFGELIAFQQYTAMFIGPCMGLLKINESIQRVWVSLDRIYGFLESSSTIVQNNKGLKIPDHVTQINMKNVNFSYSNNKILKNINYHS